MSEEPQVLSIQDRIRALKQAQTGQGSEGTGSPLLGNQPTAFALRPASSQSNGSNNNYHNNNSTVPIQPPPYSKEPPPPTPRISHVGVTPNVTPGAARQQPKRPPPLPARKSSSQQLAAPSLPPRRPSVDSVASDASRSTNTSTSALSASTTTTGKSRPTTPGSVVKAPPWGATELPPLPPKRQNTQPAVSSTVSRPKPKTVASSNGRLPVPPPRPGLPPRPSSNQSVSTVSTESSITPPQARQPPQLPRRSTRDTSPNPPAYEDTNPPPQPKRLPPPLPNGTSSPAQDAGSAGTPPPVPMGSRPDLSAIMATKPRVAASNGAVSNGASPPAAAAAVAAACMVCRDFTAPDTHAARYPRQTLPTQDIGWLARELTAPFLSATDKARAIFTWLHHNIDYDTFSLYNNCVKPSTPSSTLASGLAVCEGYAGLFAALAKEAGLEVRVVSGHGKGAGYESPAPGAPLPPFSPSGHAWNVVRLDNGHWKLIDACWGAGHTTGANTPYVRSFNPSMFTMTNDEFGLKHFPKDNSHLYRDDGRREISWEEYILGDPNSPLCAEQPRTFSDAKKHSIGERSFRPACQKISIRQAGPLRFQFNLFCEHWSLERHSRAKPGVFLLMIHGVDGRKDERLPFAHWQPAGPDGGGDVWYVDVADARVLGAPGQKVQLAVLTKLGQREDARGVTVEEYQRQVGKVGMAWAYIAEWELVA
ncbi:hypothetical protein ASPVEDRAFT_186359 [Aspergillus versicolor CBS 583.65]|uniref:Transglutaminase-like domain-containing protein n=1 Tax=Aspergillus versicolor CBS 583.65 TaxID=1036611 RepID=A0A1L9PB57_ASPVE|nr:uncharacterized protein ASPVEDRAFT_186359 [Aspergillus versicolor CBS 583.65]OJI98703.1 hypothetical protein ASPVEDRAFT_186359 [Aspergillus versicolor CBS 583.65]